jgi:branched-chain amino acid transport system ATP-binding protein
MMSSSAPILKVEGLTRRFGGLVAVNDMGFNVHAGEIVGLLGPNGSGKTTAINLISGVLRPDAGRVVLGDTDIAGWPTFRIARLGVARTFQLVRVLDGMTCGDNVRAGLAFNHRARVGDVSIDDLLARVGLADHSMRPASELTYIDRKRLELARALALRPRVLLLDEWLAGLNPSELQIGIALIRSLKDEGLSILMVEHVMDAIRSLCSRCVVMSSGRRIADGPTDVVLRDPVVIEAYLGAPEDA